MNPRIDFSDIFADSLYPGSDPTKPGSGTARANRLLVGHQNNRRVIATFDIPGEFTKKIAKDNLEKRDKLLLRIRKLMKRNS